MKKKYKIAMEHLRCSEHNNGAIILHIFSDTLIESAYCMHSLKRLCLTPVQTHSSGPHTHSGCKFDRKKRGKTQASARIPARHMACSEWWAPPPWALSITVSPLSIDSAPRGNGEIGEQTEVTILKNPNPKSSTILGWEMALIPLVRDYVGRMLQDISGMKVLVLDSQTVWDSILFFVFLFQNFQFLFS